MNVYKSVSLLLFFSLLFIVDYTGTEEMDTEPMEQHANTICCSSRTLVQLQRNRRQFSLWSPNGPRVSEPIRPGALKNLACETLCGNIGRFPNWRLQDDIPGVPGSFGSTLSGRTVLTGRQSVSKYCQQKCPVNLLYDIPVCGTNEKRYKNRCLLDCAGIPFKWVAQDFPGQEWEYNCYNRSEVARPIG